jgi:hypothetical protein
MQPRKVDTVADTLDDRHIAGLQPYASAALQTGWVPRPRAPEVDPFTDSLLRGYAPPIPQLTSDDPEERARAVANLFHRLGTSYEDPTAKFVGDQIKVEAREAVQRIGGGPPAEHFVYMLLVMGLTPAADSLDPASAFDRGDFSLEKAISAKLAGKIDGSLVGPVEKRSSGRGTFTLKVTWIRLRSMIRGPIQLGTLCIFFAGTFVLILKGYAFHVLGQLSYLPFRAPPFTRIKDRYDIRWKDIWRDQREIGNADPVARQVVASTDYSDDLLPFLLRRVFQSLEAGGGLQEAFDVVERGSVDWLEDRDRQYVLLDYLEYLLPALGFIGTLIGNGQGLATANQVVLPDPDAQAESISTMTSHLGMAFYATLVALSCAIPYLFCRSLLGRLQLAVARIYKVRLQRYLLSQIIIRRPAPPEGPTDDPAPPAHPARLGNLNPERTEQAQTFVGIVATLLYRDVPDGPTAPSRLNRELRLAALLQPREGYLLRPLFVTTGLMQPDHWDYYAGNLLVYSMLPPILDELPRHWHALGCLLYCQEVRPTHSLLRSYGLHSGFDPGRSPPETNSILPSDPRKARQVEGELRRRFLNTVKAFVARFGKWYLPRPFRRQWSRFCRDRWQMLDDLGRQRSRTVDPSGGLHIIKLIQSCTDPATRLLIVLADVVDCEMNRTSGHKSLLETLSSRP